MDTVITGLLWAHFVALAMGLGGGIAMSQIGPRLVAAQAGERDMWWPVAQAVTRIALVGLVLLLITGPLMLWLKYDGGRGLGVWFMVKMGLVAVGVVAVGIAEAAKARFRRGDESAGRVLNAAGPVIALTMIAVVAAAVLTFH